MLWLLSFWVLEPMLAMLRRSVPFLSYRASSSGKMAESNLSERKTVLEVCETIVRRGGRLAGAGIVGILQKMEEDEKSLIFGNENRSVVAIDGGLYENYPQYRTYLQDSVKELLGTEKSNNVVIGHTKDGSAIGAALLAASNSIYQQHL